MEAKAAFSRLVLATLALAAPGCVFTWGEDDTTQLETDSGLSDAGSGGGGGTAGDGMDAGGTAGDGMGAGGTAGDGMGGDGTAGADAGPVPDSEPDATTGSMMSDAAMPLVRSCDAVAGDDECLACLKAQCCETWLGCNDATCDTEAFGTFSCMADSEFPSGKSYGQCVSESAVSTDMLPQANTLSLLDCVQEEADGTDAGSGLSRCEEACFGVEL